MKKITEKSINAFLNARPFKLDNMQVEVLPNVTVLKLYNSAIAYLYNDPENTLSITNDGYFTKTTKERLNALPGVSICQKNYNWYLNGVLWNGKLIDIK